MRDWTNDIEKYCNGELTPAEMHALEKQALSDPFLADALEGAASLSDDTFSSDVAALRSKLNSRTKPTISLWVWAARIAAGIAVTALFAVLLFNNGRRDDHLAMNADKSPSPTEENTSHEMPDKAEPTDSAAGEEIASAPAPSKSARDRIAAQHAEEEVIDEEIVIPEPLAEWKEKPEIAAAPSVRRPKRVVQGFVVDAEDGRGLPGVNVTIKGTNIGTITNEDGNYEIAMDSLAEGLLFSYIGFESKEIVPGSVNGVNVALDPDISELSEVVVVGYGEARDPKDDLTVLEIAAPEGGKKAYKQYLEQHLRYPEQALNHKIEGKVTVQFTVESNGAMSDFRVVKGIGYGCEDEVIRLIKAGPKWAPTKRNHEAVRDKVKVRLRFSLPKNKK